MAKPNVSLVYDHRKQAEKTGIGKLEILVHLNREQRKFITICKCTPDEYPLIARKKFVAEQLEKAKEVVNTLLELKEELTVENFNHHAGLKFKKRVSPEEKKEQERRGSFIAFMKDALAKEKLKDSTRERKMRAILALEATGLMKTFNDVTVANVYKFEEELHKPYIQKRGFNKRKIVRDQTTIFNYHKVIHQYATRAFHFGIIDVDPYNLVKLDHGVYKERNPLSEEELERICALKDLNPSMTIARDLFIFAAYTGLSYIDSQTFDFNAFVEKHDDMYYISTCREKTGVPFYAPILPPAMEILVRYNYELPHMSNQKLNGYLKIIGEMAKIKTNVTFHVARHTFATLALDCDVPMENVSKMLGHTNTRTTAIYGKIRHTNVMRHSSEMAKKLKKLMPTMPDHDVAAALDMTTKVADTKKKEGTQNTKPQTPTPTPPEQPNNGNNAADNSGFYGFNITGYYTMW